MSVVEILFIVDMFLWGIAAIPVAAVAPYAAARPFLAWFAVLLLGLHIFAGGFAR